MTGTILISTHRLPLAGRLRESFAAKGFDVDLVADPAELKVPSEARLLVLTGEGSDTPVKRWIDEARASLEIPVFTALPGGDAIARGRDLGAEEAFGANPDPDEVVLLAIRTVDRRRLQQVTGIVGEAEAMREALERVVQIAPVDSTVLITGESGTGKELVARGLHALSPRRHRAFMAVNVAALPDTLLESELFGHEKGAFTGAIDARKGFFELADRGTLFLDEIGEMPLSTQTKLLRVIEQREFLRVGGEQPIRVDVRIIAATNQDLRSQVLEARFRRDLFYRLNILDIELPPLRRRREDVPRLVNHFVRELTQRLDRPFPGITPEAMDLLVRYDWPGNVRELRNLVESMVVLAPRNPIGPKDVPREIRLPMEGRRLLPAPAAVAMQAAREAHPEVGESEARRIRPELEFVFRTLVELRVDMDQLRRDFEVYRDEVDGRVGFSGEVPLALPLGAGGDAELGTRPRPGGAQGGAAASGAGDSDGGGAIRPWEEEEVEPGVIVYQPGMTMDDMEEQAIRAALEEMDGNRRKAAESLGIGERTLYRKIQKYGIDE